MFVEDIQYWWCGWHAVNTWVHKGGPLGPMILFFASPNYRLHIFWWKKIDIGRAIFTLISINGHYRTMSQNLFWPPFLNRIIVLKSYFKTVHVFMFFNFQPNFIEKFLRENVFSNFGHVTFFAKQKFVFWPPFWTETFFDLSFCWYMVVVLGVYIMVQVSYQNSYGKVLKNEWVLDPSLCTNGSEK